MSGCGGVDALLSYTKSACCEINVAERGPVLHAWPCCGAKPILLYIVIFLISTGPVCTGPTSESWNALGRHVGPPLGPKGSQKRPKTTQKPFFPTIEGKIKNYFKTTERLQFFER